MTEQDRSAPLSVERKRAAKFALELVLFGKLKDSQWEGLTELLVQFADNERAAAHAEGVRTLSRKILDEWIPRNIVLRIAADGDDVWETIYKLVQAYEFEIATTESARAEGVRTGLEKAERLVKWRMDEAEKALMKPDDDCDGDECHYHSGAFNACGTVLSMLKLPEVIATRGDEAHHDTKG